MQAAGLVDAFNSSTQELTMFAPLNSAFLNLTVEVSQHNSCRVSHVAALLFGWISPRFEPLANGQLQQKLQCFGTMYHHETCTYPVGLCKKTVCNC